MKELSPKQRWLSAAQPAAPLRVYAAKRALIYQDQDARFNCILVAGGEDGAGCCGFTNSLSWLAKTSSIAVRSAPDLALSMTRRIPWRSASPVTAEQYMVNIRIGVLGRRFLMAAAALSPSIWGMAKSRTTRSGLSSAARATVWRPVTASPQISHSGWDSSMPRTRRSTDS